MDIESQNSNDSSIRTQAATTEANQNNNPPTETIKELLPDSIKSIRTLPCFGSPEGANYHQDPRIKIWITAKQKSDINNIKIEFPNKQTCHLFISITNSEKIYKKIVTCQDSLEFTQSILQKDDSERTLIELTCKAFAIKTLYPHELKKLFPSKKMAPVQQKHVDPLAVNSFQSSSKTTSEYVDKIFSYPY